MVVESVQKIKWGTKMERFRHFFSRLPFIFGILATLFATLFATPTTANEYDIAILGGRVIDPERKLDRQLNIGITGSSITIMSTGNIEAATIIDATGLIVSPGFIDMHAHGQTIPAGRMQAMDGVTTGLELEAGVLPVSAYYEDLAKEGRPINYGASVNWGNARIATHMNVKPSHDLEWFFNNFKNPAWQTAISTPDQLNAIADLVSDGLDQGGLGVGFLLGYAPGAGRKEYYEISKLAANRNVPTFTHARFLSMLEPNSSFDGMAEIVSVAAGTGVQAHIVHLNSMSLSDIDIIKPMILGAQAKGIPITTEAYPYGAGATGIGAAMFQGPRWRESMGGVTAHNFDIGGKRLTEERFAYLQKEKPETGVIIHFLDLDKPTDKANLDKSVLFPGGVIASDGGPWQVDGAPVAKDVWPLPDNAWAHPRGAGTYARFLREYVRETNSVTLMEAIERISYGPAKILQKSVPQMKKKGRIQVGADADITIFNLKTITDRATFAAPAQPSDGIEYVIVNGQLLVANGKLNTDIMPGQPIRNQVRN